MSESILNANVARHVIDRSIDRSRNRSNGRGTGSNGRSAEFAICALASLKKTIARRSSVRLQRNSIFIFRDARIVRRARSNKNDVTAELILSRIFNLFKITRSRACRSERQRKRLSLNIHDGCSFIRGTLLRIAPLRPCSRYEYRMRNRSMHDSNKCQSRLDR